LLSRKFPPCGSPGLYGGPQYRRRKPLTHTNGKSPTMSLWAGETDEN
jgi:hypothetical protein